MAWYNTYRPKTFSEVIGQSIVKDVLQSSLTQNKIKHAYLFSGGRGIGKTTLARIFANELNNTAENSEARIDIIELDAASNTGVDDVRQLIESGDTPPLSGKYKIFIIDEVHMLSKPAMNALLKTLEEPPEYLIFLLATTNPEKLLPTVLSRLTKLPLSNHSTDDIVTKLKHIATAESVHISDDALQLIATRSNGSQRDAINILETVASYNLDTLTEKEVGSILGLVSQDGIIEILEAIQHSTVNKDLLEKVQNIGIDGETLLGQMLEYILDESLQGNSSYDIFVAPIAQIISWKLPITTIASTIALIQSQVKNNSPVQDTNIREVKEAPRAYHSAEKKESVTTNRLQEQNNIKTSNTPTPTELPTTSLDEITDKYHKNSTVKQDIEESNSTSSTQVNENFTATHSRETLQSKLQALLHAKSTPPLLKMVLNDVEVVSAGDNSFEFSVSNGMFLGQLQSTKNAQWLRDNLELNTIPKVTLRAAAMSSTPSPSEFKQETQETTIHYEDTTPVTEEMVQESTQTTPPIEKTASTPSPQPQEFTNKGGEDIFYKVYNELPKELEPGRIPLYTEEIPEPTPTISTNSSSEDTTQESDWDSNAHEMFDLE